MTRPARPKSSQRRETRITDRTERSRIEVVVDGEIAGWLDYRPAGDSIIIAHTEIADEYAGRGLGGALVRRAFETARAAGKTVIPICRFAASHVERHPELDAHVAPHARRRPPR